MTVTLSNDEICCLEERYAIKFCFKLGKNAGETYEMLQTAFQPSGLGSLPSRVIPKTQKMVLDVTLLNTQHYKVQIKDKVVS